MKETSMHIKLLNVFRSSDRKHNLQDVDIAETILNLILQLAINFQSR